MITRFSELKIEDMVFSPIADSVYIPSQKLSWIEKNDKSNVIIQTPEMYTETYGIPQENCFFTNDKSRCFYKMPFCHERRQYDDINYDEIQKFYDKLKEIDLFCSSDDFKKKVLNAKNVNNYEYQPIIRENLIEIVEDEEDDTNEINVKDRDKIIYKPPYTKLKIDVDYATNTPKIRLFDKSDGRRELVETKSLKDITNHMRYMTKHKFIIHISKLYCMKN